MFLLIWSPSLDKKRHRNVWEMFPRDTDTSCNSFLKCLFNQTQSSAGGMLCQDIAWIDRLLGSIESTVSRDTEKGTIWFLPRAPKRPQKLKLHFLWLSDCGLDSIASLRQLAVALSGKKFAPLPLVILMRAAVASRVAMGHQRGPQLLVVVELIENSLFGIWKLPLDRDRRGP